jgi:hypothetical protein
LGDDPDKENQAGGKVGKERKKAAKEDEGVKAGRRLGEHGRKQEADEEERDDGEEGADVPGNVFEEMKEIVEDAFGVLPSSHENSVPPNGRVMARAIEWQAAGRLFRVVKDQ